MVRVVREGGREGGRAGGGVHMPPESDRTVRRRTRYEHVRSMRVDLCSSYLVPTGSGKRRERAAAGPRGTPEGAASARCASVTGGP